MSYQIETISPFDKAIKRLAKKYRRIKQDLRVLVGMLSTNPFARYDSHIKNGSDRRTNSAYPSHLFLGEGGVAWVVGGLIMTAN